MDIQEIQDIVEREGLDQIQIIVTFLGDGQLTVGVTFQEVGLLSFPKYGDYEMLKAEDQTEEKVRETVHRLITVIRECLGGRR